MLHSAFYPLSVEKTWIKKHLTLLTSNIHPPSISFQALHLHHYRPLERELSASFLSSFSFSHPLRYLSLPLLTLSACISCCRIGVSWLMSSGCQADAELNLYVMCAHFHTIKRAQKKKTLIKRPKPNDTRLRSEISNRCLICHELIFRLCRCVALHYFICALNTFIPQESSICQAVKMP